jgi:hypothetical protein
MFYLSLSYQQNMSDSDLDRTTHTSSFLFSDQVPFLNYDVEQRIESP